MQDSSLLYFLTMLSFIPRFFLYAFSSAPSQPDRPGSFSAQQIEEILRIYYTEEEKTEAPALALTASAPAPAPRQETQPLTEGEDEDVAIPMQTLAVEEVEIVERVEEPQDADSQVATPAPNIFPETSPPPPLVSVPQEAPKHPKENKPALTFKGNLPTTPDYIPAEVSLETIGYFTPSSKRIKGILTKEKKIAEKTNPDGT